MREGFLMALWRGYQNFLLASNSQEAVSLGIRFGECWSNLGNLVEDVRNLLVHLQVRDVFYQPRKGNEVAHFLAHFGAGLRWWRIEKMLSVFEGGVWYSFSLTEFSSTGSFQGKVL
ncbi:hypothetical protein ACE6H2_018954 [Prunus campanulata]